MRPNLPNGLTVEPIILTQEYREEWNERIQYDFVQLYKDGKRLRDTLYRVGGIGYTPNALGYFMLIKYIESEYDIDWLKKNKLDTSNQKHLSGQFTIINKNGDELFTEGKFDNTYIIGDSCIGLSKDTYFNFVTNETLGKFSNKMESATHLFFEDKWNDDPSRRGVMIVNKITGEWEMM